MKTFADFNRRIALGVRLLTVRNTYRPELDGKEREVTRVQTNGFWWRVRDDSRESFTRYPKATETEIVDTNTIRFGLGYLKGADQYVELRFITE